MLSRVLIDKISKREEGDEGCNKRNHPTSVSGSRGEGRQLKMNCRGSNVECDQC